MTFATPAELIQLEAFNGPTIYYLGRNRNTISSFPQNIIATRYFQIDKKMTFFTTHPFESFQTP